MIITEKFVFLHLPKTAGTWVRDAACKIHFRWFKQQHLLGKVIVGLRPLWLLLGTNARTIADSFLLNPAALVDLRDPLRSYLRQPRWLRRTLFALGRKRSLNIRQALRQYLYQGTPNKTRRTYTALSKLTGLSKHQLGLHYYAHYGYTNVPADARGLPVVSCMRDPFSWHASLYRYSVVEQQYQYLLLSRHKQLYRQDMSFADYLVLVNQGTLQRVKYQNYVIELGYQNKRHRLGLETIPSFNSFLTSARQEERAALGSKGRDDNFAPKVAAAKSADGSGSLVPHIGLMTLWFIITYFKRPWEVLSMSPRDFYIYWQTGGYKADMAKVTFLQQENVNADFAEYLQQAGYPQEIAAGIINEQRVNTSANAKLKLQQSYHRHELIDIVYELEQPIFTLFPQYKKIYRQLLAGLSA